MPEDTKFIPHKHTCEIKLFHPTSWEEKCPIKGNLSETEDECEKCSHFVIVNFDPDNPVKITGIIRDDGFMVAETASSRYRIKTQDKIEHILNEIKQSIKSIFGSKLHKIILYGSYARGDHNEDSDIDIMVLADIDKSEIRAYTNSINEIAHDLSLEYNELVTIFLKDKQTFYQFIEILPYYKNVINEGVEIYGQ